MKLSEKAVKNPITTLMLFIAVLVFGVMANLKLPRDIFPDIELPTLTIITVYPGASASEVEQEISKPIEKVLGGIERLKKIQSSSRENVSFVSLQFDWGTDIQEAAANARDLIELVKSDLPKDAQAPFIMKINTSIMPVVILGVQSNGEANMDKVIDEIVSPALRKQKGVGTVFSIAQPTPEIKVEVDPLLLYKYSISTEQVATALRLQNIDIPGGNVQSGVFDLSVRIPGSVNSPEELKSLVIGSNFGAVVRLEDVAKVSMGMKDKDEIARANGNRATALMVQKQTGANTMEAYHAVMNSLPEISKKLPEGMKIYEVFNTAEVIEISLSNLGDTLWMGGLFVILVVLIFLRKIRSSIIIGLTIPFSLIVSFIVMQCLGYSINVFSLMSLVVAIGMVVDNAIVVLENITRHIDQGAKPIQASIFGTSEMGLAITASTLTTIAVFFPMIFAGGIVGVFFEQFAIITAATMLASLITSLTLTPMLSSKMLKPIREEKKGNYVFRWSEKVFEKVENGYRRILKGVIRRKYFALSLFVAILLSSLLSLSFISTDYIPAIDSGDVVVVIKTAEGTGASETEKVAIKVEELLNTHVPEVKYGFTVAGQTEKGILSSIGFSEGKNIATIAVHLCSPDERTRSAEEIAASLELLLSRIPEVEKYHVSGGSILASALLGNVKPIEVVVSGPDLAKISKKAKIIADSMRSYPFLRNVDNSADLKKPEFHIVIDRNLASANGLNTAMIAMQIRQSLYGADAGVYKENGDNTSIVVRYEDKFRQSPQMLGEIQLMNVSGKMVLLKEVADIRQGSGPIEIRHESQERIVKVSADLNGIALGDAARRIHQLLSNISNTEGVEVELMGQVAEQGDSFANLKVIFLISLMLVFMIMAAQFESLKDPLIIIMAIPFTLVGVIASFLITGTTLSMVTFVGVIMLIGIVVNNGIVLVDYTNLLLSRGYLLTDAIFEAGRSRLRPVLMTTLTTILGMLPMALSNGLMSEMWSPLGITVIGGLLFSTIVTLFFVPLLYYFFNHKKQKK